MSALIVTSFNESSQEVNNYKNNKQLNTVYKTVDIYEPINTCIKLKKNIKEHNWKKHCKQIKKKQQQKVKTNIIKKNQKYKHELNHNYSDHDISWYYTNKDNINTIFEGDMDDFNYSDDDSYDFYFGDTTTNYIDSLFRCCYEGLCSVCKR